MLAGRAPALALLSLLALAHCAHAASDALAWQLQHPVVDAEFTPSVNAASQQVTAATARDADQGQRAGLNATISAIGRALLAAAANRTPAKRVNPARAGPALHMAPAKASRWPRPGFQRPPPLLTTTPSAKKPAAAPKARALPAAKAGVTAPRSAPTAGSRASPTRPVAIRRAVATTPKATKGPSRPAQQDPKALSALTVKQPVQRPVPKPVNRAVPTATKRATKPLPPPSSLKPRPREAAVGVSSTAGDKAPTPVHRVLPVPVKPKAASPARHNTPTASPSKAKAATPPPRLKPTSPAPRRPVPSPIAKPRVPPKAAPVTRPRKAPAVPRATPVVKPPPSPPKKLPAVPPRVVPKPRSAPPVAPTRLPPNPTARKAPPLASTPVVPPRPVPVPPKVNITPPGVLLPPRRPSSPPPPPQVRYCQIGSSSSRQAYQLCCAPAAEPGCPLCAVGARLPASQLYGCNGEAFNVSTRLLDWSYAGYAAGDRPPPMLAVAADLKQDFGAKGDGVTDDTEAFLTAVTNVRNRAVLFIPQGTYIITKRLFISTRTVLRGAGPGKTILKFPLSLEKVYGRKLTGNGASSYGRGRAWIEFEGVDRTTDSRFFRARVLQDAPLGATRLVVSNASTMAVGDWVVIVADNPKDGSLEAEMNLGQGPAPKNGGTAEFLKFGSRVDAVGPDFIELSRKLPLRLRAAAWNVRIVSSGSYGRTLTGVESMTISMAWTAFPGVTKEAGYNALSFGTVQHGWVRNVEFENADLGLVLWRCTFFSATDLIFKVTKPRSSGLSGSRAIWIKGGSDVLVSHFDIRALYEVDVSVTFAALAPVIANGKGQDLCIAAETSGPYGMLVTGVDFGKGTRPWAGTVGAAGRMAVWNVWATQGDGSGLLPPPSTYGPAMTIVGYPWSKVARSPRVPKWHLEALTGVPGGSVAPRNLYSSMRRRAPDRACDPEIDVGAVKPPPSYQGPAAGSGPALPYVCTLSGQRCCLEAERVSESCPLCDPDAEYLLPSRLWGCQGEALDPKGRIMDWSYAGYGAGEVEPPTNLPILANLKLDYGAVGDGVTDDTPAFLAALNTAERLSGNIAPRPYVLKDIGAPLSSEDAYYTPAPKPQATSKTAGVYAAAQKDGTAAAPNTTAPAAALPAADAVYVGAGKAAFISAQEAGGLGGDSGDDSDGLAGAAGAKAALPPVVPEYGSTRQVRYASWAADPMYTLLLDPSEYDSAATVGVADGKPGTFAARGSAVTNDDDEPAAVPPVWADNVLDMMSAVSASNDSPEGRTASSPTARRLAQATASDGSNATVATGALLSTPVLQDGVLFIPEGVYVLKRRVDIRRQGLVIRGAGVNKTIIYIPHSMSEAYGNTFSEGGNQGTSDYSHGVGFINFFGYDPMTQDTLITPITRAARRGDRRLYVSNAPALADYVGKWVRVTQDGDIGALITDMYGGYYTPGPGQMASNSWGRVYRLMTRVTAVGPGWVEIERPLTANVSTAWRPEIHMHRPMIKGNGLEHLTIRFKWEPYQGHLMESGFNAVHMNQLHNSWIRNVNIVNSDAGIYLWGCQGVTMTGVVISTTKSRGSPTNEGLNGHRGVWMERGADNLLTRFSILAPMIHDVTLSWTEQHSVVSNGQGTNLNIDHHRNSPYSNLLTGLDHGIGSRPWESSGNSDYGPHTAAYATFWGNSGRMSFYYPQPFGSLQAAGPFGPLVTFVGYRSRDQCPRAANWYAENLWPRLWPQNLHKAQLGVRLQQRAAAGGAPS